MLRKARIKVETDNVVRLVNRLIYKNVGISRLRYVDGGGELCVKDAELGKVREICDECGALMRIKKRGGAAGLKAVGIKSVGLIVGVVIAVAATAVVSNFTFEIAVSGNEYTPTEEIVETLRENGAYELSFGKRDTKKLADAIVSSSDKISYCSVKYKGTCLEVKVKEELPPTHIYEENREPIVALYDGVISRIMVSEGTAKVKEGDRVRKGDVLIEPYITVGEEPNTELKESRAIGVVYARCWDSQDVLIADANVVNVRSGKTKSISVVSVFGLSFKKVKPPFAAYECESEERRIFSLFPVRVTTYTFYEVKERVFDRTDSEYVQARLTEAYASLNAGVVGDDKLLRSWIIQKELDNADVYNVYYEIERRIDGGVIGK